MCIYYFLNKFSKIPSKIETLKKKFFFSRYMIVANNVHLTYYQRNKDLILSKAKKYYENNKEKLSKQEK